MLLTVTVLALCLVGCECANVLVIPSHVNSHLLFMSQMAAAIDGKHNVSILLPSNAKVPELLHDTGVNVMTFPSPGETSAMSGPEFSKLLIKIAFCKSFFEQMSLYAEMSSLGLGQIELDCEGRFQLMPEIRARGFDFAIVDGTDFFCGPLIPYALDIPFGFISISFIPIEFRVPALPSFTPMSTTGLSDRMNFWQRTLNTILTLIMPIAANHTLHFAERFVPEKPTLDAFEFHQRASLWLLFDDMSIGYPFPLMPNVIPVADMMAKPSKPLPSDFQVFLDGSSEGAILVSLGSVLSYIPQDVLDKFCEAFSQIPLKFIWRLPKDNSGCSSKSLRDRMMTSSWLPQNDILGHPNLKLFINHGGLNSVVESINHVVPMVVIPYGLDGHSNAAKVTDKHLGVRMNIAEFTSEELVSNIRNVLNNNTYHQAVELASVLLKNKPDTPGERASFWIQHISHNSAAALRRSAKSSATRQFSGIQSFCSGLMWTFLVSLDR